MTVGELRKRLSGIKDDIPLEVVGHDKWGDVDYEGFLDHVYAERDGMGRDKVLVLMAVEEVED